MKGRSKSRGDAGDASGRRALLEQLMEQYDSALLRYAMRILNSREAAQDVVQNTFIKLFKGLEDGMEPSDKVRAWLYRVTHNEAVDYIRRESRFRAMQDRYQDALDHGGNEGEGERRESQKDQVLRHLAKLDEKEQQVVLLRLEEGLSYKEIAEVTGRTVGNVGNLLHHSVKKLSGYLVKERVSAEIATAPKDVG